MKSVGRRCKQLEGVRKPAGQRLESLRGRNTEGQAGSTTRPIVTEPKAVEGLHGLPVHSIAAGQLSSACVVAGEDGGEAWTWGCGKAGKLGQGSTMDISAPARVEGLVGRGHVAAVALGHSHSLFLDAAGRVYSCGENKEGQCGYGTSLDAIAQQRQQEWALGAMGLRGAAQQTVSQQSGAGASAESAAGTGEERVTVSWGAGTYLHSFTDGAGRTAELQRTKRLLEQQQGERSQSNQSGSGSGSGSGILVPSSEQLQQSWQGQMLAAHGLLPGQSHTPARLGRDLHELMAAEGDATPEPAGIERECVTHVAASRYFSALCTDRGEVWTVGGGFNGELGNGGSWITSAQRVGGEVARAIEENGGAVSVETGGAFCICLTSSGRAIVWGKLGHAPQSGASRKPAVAEIMGLPRMQHIAAGHSHALLSDGDRVWALGRWLNADGSRQVGSAWERPQEVLRLPEGIASITAGAHCSAAVSGNGELWLWGKLLGKEHAKALGHQHGNEAVLNLDDEQAWSFMGSDHPRPLPGLSGVRQVALGAVHGLVLTD